MLSVNFKRHAAWKDITDNSELCTENRLNLKKKETHKGNPKQKRNNNFALKISVSTQRSEKCEQHLGFHTSACLSVHFVPVHLAPLVTVLVPLCITAGAVTSPVHAVSITERLLG